MPAIYIDELDTFMETLAVKLKAGVNKMRAAGVQTKGPESVDVTVTLLKRGGVGTITRKTVVDQSTEETVTTGEDDRTVATGADSKTNSGGTNSETLFYYEADEV